MRESITIIVMGVPVAKGRARSRIITPKGKKPFVSHYTPSETVAYEQRVGWEARRVMGSMSPLDCPIESLIVMCLPVPESWSQKKKDKALLGEIKHTTKPDKDNIEKALNDGLNGVAYRDDALIWKSSSEKRYAAIPRVEITLFYENQTHGAGEKLQGELL